MPEVDLRRLRRRPGKARRWAAVAVVLAVAVGSVALWWTVGGLLPGPFVAPKVDSASVVEPPAAIPEDQPSGADAGPDSDLRPAHEGDRTLTRPIRWWLAAIARQAGRGLVIDPAIVGDVTADFGGNEWEPSLAAFSRTVGFSYSIDDGFIEVRHGRESWRAEASEARASGPDAESRPVRSRPDASVQKPAVTATSAAAAKSEPLVDNRPVMELLRLEGRPSTELVESLGAAVRALGVRADADPGSGAVLLTGPREAVGRAKRMIARLDVSRRSVVLEAQIVELSKKARDELGVQWSVAGRVGADVDFPAADTTGETAAFLLATAGRQAVHARLAALEADGLVRVVSRPRVVVMEGRPASIESVRVLRIRLPNRTALVDGESALSALGNSRAVEEIPVGVSLEVSPTALGDGRVVLAIKAKSSTLGPPQPPDGIPEEFSRQVEAEVVVASGDTAVLGGLMRQGTTDTGSGVPGLRSIPLLGRLFGRRRKETESEELLFLVTPTVTAEAPAPPHRS